MLRIHRLLVAVFALGLVSLSALGRAALSKRSETPSLVKFTAVGPAGMKIEGTTPDLSVKEKDGRVIITVPLANLTTRMEVRDGHMKDKYLEVSKFPSAELSVARSALKAPGSGDVVGELTLHGQTNKSVSVHYDVKQDGAALLVDGKIHIDMKKDFGIDPSFAGVHVKPDVDVEAHFGVAGGE